MDGCKFKWNENPNRTFHSPRYCTDIWEWNVLPHKRNYCDTILLTSNCIEKIPSPPKILHFLDNSKFDPDQHHKKLYKVQPVLDHLKSKCSSICTPEQNICVVESLLLWKGQLSWIKYIPSMQSRSGINTYKLCESSTGYVWNFVVYTSKDTI